MNSFDSLGRGPSCNGRQLGRVHSDTTTSNYHAKELNLRFVKVALGQFESEIEIMELLKNKADFAIKIVHGVGTDSNVIHIDDEPSFANVIRKIEVHKCLKCRGGPTESKKHYCWFK